MPSIRRGDPRTAAQQIADYLREQVATGQLKPGDKLPSTNALCEEWGVVDGTVRKAIGLLRNEGILTSQQGRGVFVRNQEVLPHIASNALRPGRPDRDIFVENAERHGRRPHKHFQCRTETAPDDIAQRLGVARGSEVVLRIVRQWVDDEPWSIQTGYYPLDLAQQLGLDVDHDIKPGTRRVLADAGHADAGRLDEWIVRAPTPDEAEELQMVSGSGVKLLVKTSTVASSSRVTRVIRELLPDDRNIVIYEQGDDDALDLIRSTRNGEAS